MESVPFGLCGCGCGQQTGIRTQTQYGFAAGTPYRFLKGHHRRGEGIDPTAIAARFWSHVKRDTGCWLWTAYGPPHGYGFFEMGGRSHSAHRVAWLLTYGPIPAELYVCHRCNVKRCVRPDHLYLGTCQQNAVDAIKDGLWPAGEKSPHAKLTEQDVRQIRAVLAGSQPPSQTALARQYGVSQAVISRVWLGKGWKKVV